MKYNLSIIIPTKNRQYYCYESLKQIINVVLDSNYEVEVIVCDNSNNKDLEYKIRELNKSFIKYYYNPGIVSFVDNFDYALKKANGDYLIAIGDDDGILPEMFQLLSYAYNNNIDAIVPDLGAVYFWPSNSDIVKDSKSGLLIYSQKDPKIIFIETQNGIHRLLSKAGQEYQSADLARLYHGIVRKDVIKSNIEGKYFGGLTPDIYIAVSASLHAKNVIRTTFPITISGICEKSGSSDSATGIHKGKLSDAPHFKGHENYIWEKLIPQIYSVETIWAETVIKALRDFDMEKMINKFNIKYLEFLLYKKYSDILKEVQYKKNNNFFVNSFFKYKIICNKVVRRIARKLIGKCKVYRVKNTININEASYYIKNKQNEKFKDRLKYLMEVN
ncbi:MAG: glycosyltransferase [Firmicutes bacterium]|nr:glycosyltransferase [Bacillota bacterium]